ncbi:transposase, partial [Methanocrinis sp.]|uniref:transposase n=1 Tax=Methanocrinis sp. TaxID=3101522 RepID=UPI003D0AAF65
EAAILFYLAGSRRAEREGPTLQGGDESGALSNGEKIDNPRFFRSEEKALAKAQRRLSKCAKGTSQGRAAVKVVQRVHERIANRKITTLSLKWPANFDSR